MSARGSGGSGKGTTGRARGGAPRRHPIPDLWRRGEEDAGELYGWFLERLERLGRHERVITAARQIRRYAKRVPEPSEVICTYSYEITALLELKRPGAAWRQFRRKEELIFGKRFDLATQKWTRAHITYLLFHLAPFLYRARRYREGCALLEKGLELTWRGESDSLLICGEVIGETAESYVPLDHFYRKLGKDLREWREKRKQWQERLRRFFPELYEPGS